MGKKRTSSKEIDRKDLEEALRDVRGDLKGAADLLGIPVKELSNLLAKYEVNRQTFVTHHG